MQSYFGGIDPGKNGGIVILNLEGRIVEIERTPVIKVATKKGRKQGRDEYDIPAISKLLKASIPHVRFALEKATPMPAKFGGAIAQFHRGAGFYLWKTALTVLGIPHTLMHPKTWQSAMFLDVSKKDTKQASIIVAQRLWPNQDWRLSDKARKPHSGFTDAALIAEYGRRLERRAVQ